MFQHQGVWLPDGEAHFPGWMDRHGELVEGRGTYQIKKWRACLPWIRNWRCALDVGAHVGFWTLQMAARFSLVRAFEPVAEFQQCWYRNTDGVRNAYMHPYALGSVRAFVSMKVPELAGGIDSGGTHVAPYTDGRVPMFTLDYLDYPDVDFIKIDCEGYEHNVVLGAVQTLKRCRPCVIVEQKPHKLGPNFGIKGVPAVNLLTGIGAKVREVISGDYILSWDD